MPGAGTYIFYSLLLAVMIFFSKPSVLADNQDGTVDSRYYWGNNLKAIVALYTFIIGCRYFVGIDYEAYLGWYLELNKTGVYPRDIEFGYEWLNKLLYYLNAHYAFLFVIIAFLQIFFLYKSLQKFPFLLPWYIFFFFTTLLMFSSMNIMRQSLAYFIFFYALNLAIDKRYLQAALLCVVGYSFHKTMLLPVALFPLLGFDWFKNRYVQMALLLIVMVFASRILDLALTITAPFVSLLGYGYYVENLDYMYEISEEGAVGAGTAKFFFFFIDFSIVIFSQQLKDRFKSQNFYKYYNIYFLGALLERIVADNFILARTNDYLLNFRVLILSFLCYYLFSSFINRNVRWALGSVIVLVMTLFFYRAIYNSAAKAAPFRFLFFEREIKVKKTEHESP